MLYTVARYKVSKIWKCLSLGQVKYVVKRWYWATGI